MRPFIFIALLGVMLVTYQNCGGDVRTQGLFAEDNADSFSSFAVSDDCEGNSCVKPAELLWIKIRESEPYKVDTNTMITTGHFTVGGRCGVGTFTNHTVNYELREAFGQQEVVSAGYHDNVCDVGQFQISIAPNTGSADFQTDKKYILTLEILGLGNGNQPVSNPMPANVARIDVVFESDN